MIKKRNLDPQLRGQIFTYEKVWKAGGAFDANEDAKEVHILDGSSAAVAITGLTPVKVGQKVVLACVNATNAVTVKTGSGVTFDGTNNTATFAANKALQLVAISLTRWLIITNVGSVSFSST